jgi:hypothetical protein
VLDAAVVTTTGTGADCERLTLAAESASNADSAAVLAGWTPSMEEDEVELLADLFFVSVEIFSPFASVFVEANFVPLASD